MSSPANHSTILLQDLRLDSACALLQKGDVAFDTSDPTAYLQSVIDGLCELSLKDPLTGLSNRRHFNTVLEAEVDRVARSGEAALLLLIDIDHFKSVNDTHGHPAGDEVLRVVAKTLQGCVRPMDTLARYGGEEFVVVLPACQPAFGHAVAERIRRTIESTSIAISPNVDLNVTISIGGAFALQWIRSTTELWTDRADQQLYLAKSTGRNRLCLEAQPESTVSAEEKNLLFGHLSATEPAWIDMTSSTVENSAAQR
ncbi:GGDEF domain-containing protein [Rhodoferax sp.]|uniref:GGDEF domain-containing protein n=1 Tax=Rhodoferax sp. TaxID=50421 RepID=UPI00374CFC25